jgi:hypothetical protein
MHKMMADAYLNLGQKSQDSIGILAEMSAATTSLGLPFQIVQKQVQETAEKFKFFGDNSRSALDILSAFGPALKESGLGPRAVEDIVSGLVGGVKQMDVATKSFISGASGGKKGLSGAFEMDLLLKEGKLAEVLKRTTAAVQKQFGSPIVSVEEASKDQGKAATLFKQQEFIKQFGLADSDDKAQRILEALKAGSAEKLGDVFNDKDKQKSDVESQTTLGNQKLERANTYLVDIANNTRLTAISAGIENARTVRNSVVGKLGSEKRGVGTTYDVFGGKEGTRATAGTLIGKVNENAGDITGKADKVRESLLSFLGQAPRKDPSESLRIAAAASADKGVAAGAKGGEARQSTAIPLSGKISIEVKLTKGEQALQEFEANVSGSRVSSPGPFTGAR